MRVLPVIFTVIILCLFGYPIFSENPSNKQDVPATTIEYSVDGYVKSEKIPAGSSVHIIQNEGRLMAVKINQYIHD